MFTQTVNFRRSCCRAGQPWAHASSHTGMHQHHQKQKQTEMQTEKRSAHSKETVGQNCNIVFCVWTNSAWQRRTSKCQLSCKHGFNDAPGGSRRIHVRKEPWPPDSAMSLNMMCNSSKRAANSASSGFCLRCCSANSAKRPLRRIPLAKVFWHLVARRAQVQWESVPETAVRPTETELLFGERGSSQS